MSERDLFEVVREVSRGCVVLAFYPWARDQVTRFVLSVDGDEPRLVALPQADKATVTEAVGRALAAAMTPVPSPASTTNHSSVVSEMSIRTLWEQVFRALEELGDLLLKSPLSISRRVRDGSEVRDGVNVSEILNSRLSLPIRIIPHGLFHRVPWSALLHDKKHLALGHPVSLLPGLRLFRGELPAMRRGVALLASHAGVKDKPGYLKHVAVEIERLRAVLEERGWQTNRLSDGSLKRLSLLQHMADSDLLHFAMHGRFGPAAPKDKSKPIDELQVMIDGPHSSALEFGEELTVAEILGGGPIRAHTVVLSACLTGAADERRAYDPLSLAAAFMARGARTVVASQWPVDDESTCELMSRVYTKVLRDGQGWASALNEVQREFIVSGASGVGGSRLGALAPPKLDAETVRPPVIKELKVDWSSPYVWAPFQVHEG